MKKGPFAQYAAYMLGGGYSPLPLYASDGKPSVKEWQALRIQPMTVKKIAEQIRRDPNFGLAVVGGFNGLVPVDLDTDDQSMIDAFCSVMPEPVVVRRGSKGFVAFYRSLQPMAATKLMLPNGTPVVEALTTGNVTIPPSLHRKTRRQYEWETKDTLFNTRVDELSIVDPEHIEDLRAVFSPWVQQAKKFEPAPVSTLAGETSNTRQSAYARAMLASEAKRLSGMGPNTGRNRALFEAGCKIGKYVHHGIITYAEVENALLAACQTNGLAKDDGIDNCRASLRSGISKAVNDQLPALRDRERCAA